MNASCADGKLACSGLCNNYDAAANCWNCQNKYDMRYAYPQNGLEFYCGDEECGKECAWVYKTFTEMCMGLANASECVLCGGADARPALDRCNACLPRSRLYTEQRFTALSSLAEVYDMCKGPTVPDDPPGCEEECYILVTYDDLCGTLDENKCKGICSVSTEATPPDIPLTPANQPPRMGSVQHLCPQQPERLLSRDEASDPRTRHHGARLVCGRRPHQAGPHQAG
jgi:hypothetical protein